MGGKKKGGVVGGLTGAISTGVGVATGGVVDVANGKINTNVEDAGKNFAESISGGKIIDGITPELPKMPGMENVADQLAKAKAAADAKLESEGAKKSSGLASTILGGSISTDDSVLKKKKLLGA